jgi:hypothetical protein
LLQNEDDDSDRVEDSLSYYMALKKAGFPIMPKSPDAFTIVNIQYLPQIGGAERPSARRARHGDGTGSIEVNEAEAAMQPTSKGVVVIGRGRDLMPELYCRHFDSE